LPNAAEIAEINARHLVRTPIKPADLLFVFGTRETLARRVDEALRLWREGLFRWSIVSGRCDAGLAAFGMRDHQQAMVAARHAAELILEEHCALNTGENVVFSLPIIDAALGLSNVRSVICLGNTWTARRYPMTLHGTGRRWRRCWSRSTASIPRFRTGIPIRLSGPDP